MSASVQLLLLTILLITHHCHADTFRIGRRVAGDMTVLKKVLLSVPSNAPTNHTVIYEYRATKAVSCIEYQVENLPDQTERVAADISFTGEYSLAATFHLVNITELVIVMSIYGFDQFSVPLDFRPILVPQSLLVADDGVGGGGDGSTAKFGLGFRRAADELVYFYTQSTTRTDALRNHTLVFETELEHHITYVSFAVDSKSAGVTFLLMTEHEFRAIVYDINARILFANLYVYGYKKEKLPDDYQSMLPPTPPAWTSAASIPFDADEEIRLKGELHHIETASAQNGSAGRMDVMIHHKRMPAILLAMLTVVFIS